MIVILETVRGEDSFLQVILVDYCCYDWMRKFQWQSDRKDVRPSCVMNSDYEISKRINIATKE